MTSKIAIVTGAGSGIGRACALALLENGWSVALAGRRKHALEETAKLALEATERAFPVSTDIGNPDSVAALFAAVKQRFGRLDFLFNNAGDNAPSVPLEELAYEDWARVVQTNLTGTFLCAQQAFRVMKSQSPMGGRIVNNGALSAHMPRPDSIAFTTTKTAITGLTRSLSLDGRKYDIACGQLDISNTTIPTDQPTPPHAAKQADGTFQVEPSMDIKHVAETVVMMANMPLDTNFQFVTLIPTKVPYIGRG
ncbi:MULTISPECIES: SDR family oxidoreductase [Planktothrix]|jgi:NAD(P)-dependent dehydrogenase (short-subunit alcohol dehydrogenase family)|uniref:Oxidoreductase n=1 Tax=Planktothrix rubescens CCAP 1459/22 TaxID=329571 RepID=A0A6J7ZEJ9_PLARU|nr:MULTISPECIES: SDR family oxidoreductase [Planktothrix]CAC5339790.1 putative oxidoreductase [Planktothrix rubescens NIVA-CYA 18]CAD5986413.1 3-beta-hydroxycholanate 3-dehydrogenase (NADP(+)) [Planktothrix rubescens NIVA-CYA 18]CAH2575652.1 3-beta-hydroxycholanate 3-dehydrogenase (NADP(+)) [Planktothrix rubescens]